MSNGGSDATGVWPTLRYRRLLPLTRGSRGAGRVYARLVAAVELGRDAARRDAAVARIARALGVDRGEATRIFRASLASEAREEADSTYFMSRGADALRAVCRSVGTPVERAAVYATLHFGSPILCYLSLHLVRKVAVHIIGRKLDAANPMPLAKRAYGVRKVAWVERLAERPFVDVDGPALTHMRSRLLDGDSAFAAVDVPGSVVARRVTVPLFGERVVLSAGVPTLARLARVPMQAVVGVSRPDGIEVRYGEPVDSSDDDAVEVLMARMADLVRAAPSEWWMWPYLETVPD